MRAWNAQGLRSLRRLRHCGLARRSERRGAAAQSRLYEVTKSKKLRVCQFPLYYSISFRNPKTGQIEGIDADLAKELAKELDAKLEIVESELRHLHRRPAGEQVRDRHVRRRRDAEARAGGGVLQALPRHQHLRGDAQGRQDQELGGRRQEGREGGGLARQLHRALHEELPEERGDGRRWRRPTPARPSWWRSASTSS